jgi:hypothetical protein
MLSCFGLIRISTPTLYAECNVVPYNTYLNDWTTFSIPLTDSAWGVTPEKWDSILTNVTGVCIYMDAQMDYIDRTGLDNFTITSSALKVVGDSQDHPSH